MTTYSTRDQSGGALARIAVIVFAVLQILTPMLPELGLGRSIGERSDSVRTLITPAGWAFSIWGALYTGSIVFAVYQALPAQRANPLLARLRWPAAGAFAGNAVWAAYTQVFGLSVISSAIILFTLACLLTIYRRLAAWNAPFSAGERWCAILPLAALASWLTAASIVNIAASLRFHGVEAGEAAPLIAAAVVVVGGVIASLALIRGRGNPPYALVFLWALSAIYAVGGPQAGAVAAAAGIAALLVIVATVLGLRRGGLSHWFG
ncbi:hypothetical protein [Novosphingobium sp. M1R2S20]|uniref:TspO/MBR related protein n=1 Tax=Novosphingobium rhizovicinum TaxID=3228928 RepID=A0ABV3RC53_9SPHN